MFHLYLVAIYASFGLLIIVLNESFTRFVDACFCLSICVFLIAHLVAMAYLVCFITVLNGSM